MAEKDKVKRGFAFYLFTLAMILLAAFLVIVMIMLFSPFKSILGVEYISYDDTATVTRASGQAVDFSQIDNVVVNSSYAKVLVTKSSKKDSLDCVQITNKVKGFSKSSSFVDFEYSLQIAGKTLTISIKEPEAFLYFSKDISINIRLGASSASNFSNTSFDIITGSGSVTIGNSAQGEQTQNLQIANLSVLTERGDITITSQNGDSDNISYGNLTLISNNGDVTVGKNVTVSDLAKVTLASKNRAKFENINGNVELALGNGSFSAKTITGNVTVTQLLSGSVDIDSIEGESASFEANTEMNRASIKIGKLKDVSIPFANGSNITLGQVLGNSIIYSTSGSITVSQGIGKVFDILSDSGNINLAISDDKSEALERNVNSKSGNISLNFLDHVYNINSVTTKGNVNIVIPSGSEFTLDINTYDGTPIKKLGSRVSINFVDDVIYEREHPLRVDYPSEKGDQVYQQNQVVVRSDGYITVKHA